MSVRSGRRTIQAPLDRKRLFLDHEIPDNLQLETWFQLHLATDTSAVATYPLPSSRVLVQKWTIRINSSIHSKDPGARWAGLSIALKATLSRDIMNEPAHAWITAALPMFFVSQNLVRAPAYRRTGLYRVPNPALV